jgi:carbonic anhydrase
MPSSSINDLFEHNRAWAARMEREKPGFFTGCSDSRVPANQITGLEPGEVFVHRNVANVVVPTDLNCLSTIQYAVDQLKVEHLMVVGHYGCGGVLAALEDVRVGLADNWIRHVKDVRDKHAALLDGIDLQWRHDALCELNAIEQVLNIAHSTVMQDAWARGQKVQIHGWCYSLRNGLITNLHMTVPGVGGLHEVHQAAVEQVAQRARQ